MEYTEYTALKLKKVSLEQDLEYLTKQYEAVDNKYRRETNPVDRISHEAEREHL
jgi:hypothetical protein